MGLHGSDENSKKSKVLCEKLGGPLDKELSNYLQIRCEQRQGNLHSDGEDNESLHPCRGFSPLSADRNHWHGGWEGKKR